MRIHIKKLAPLFFFAVALICPVSTSADTDSAVQWLSSQSNSDGSYASPGDIATPLQATAETLRSFNIPSSNQSGVATAREYISAETFRNTEYLSRQIVSGAEAGVNISAHIAQLLTHQNRDNGFGDFTGYDSTVIDTALALEALALSGQPTSQAVGFAISYLLSKQNSDGGWAYNTSDSSPTVTAITLTALWQYRNIFNLDVE